ncbi:MAG: TatD family hydrolase [Thiotrichaceae bacterium]|nr:TatD family hydrolase [Thiotrichaceae bacterium]
MLIDSHCHLDKVDLKPFGNDINTMLDNAREVGVSQFLCVAIDLEHFDDVHQLALAHDDIHCSVGLHPVYQDGEEPTYERLLELASQPKVIAIGETGLDYFHFKENEDMTWQQERFRIHIRAAITTGKPLIIHMRNAKEDTLRILAEENAQDVGGVMHCFAEDWETAKQALALGFYISFSGIVTFNSAKTLQDVARQMPEDKILIETDSPWLAPAPHRGKPNQPAYVSHVADKVAELRGVDVEFIQQLTHANYKRLFKLAI